jgi:branched-chain amino acid transport system permease protein
MASDAFPRQWLWVGRLAVLVVLVLLPLLWPKPYILHVISLAMIMAIAALGLQLLVGFAGLLSLGQAAFLGIGAYTAGILTARANVPFEVAFLAAGLFSGLASLALVPIARLSGVYLAVATLGFAIIVHLIILNEEWLTGGAFGLLGIPLPSLGTWMVKGEAGMYWLCLFVLTFTFTGLHLLIPSRFGRALQAIMLDEDAARASGINVLFYKSQAFVVAAVITGLAGSLIAHHNQYLNPNEFTFFKSLEILVMISVGGIGSLGGAILGAFTITLLPELLRGFDQYRMLIFGAMLVVFMGIPGGLAGLGSTAIRRLLRVMRPSSVYKSTAKAAGESDVCSTS